MKQSFCALCTIQSLPMQRIYLFSFSSSISTHWGEKSISKSFVQGLPAKVRKSWKGSLLTIQSGLLHGPWNIAIISNISFPSLGYPFFYVICFACSPACFMFSVYKFLTHFLTWKLHLYTDWASPITLQHICKPRRTFPIIVLVKAVLRFSLSIFGAVQKTFLYVIWEQFVFSHFNDDFVAKTGHVLTFSFICNFSP